MAKSVRGHRGLPSAARRLARRAKANRKTRQGDAPLKSRLGWVVVTLGVVATFGALYLLTGAVNGIAYLSGAGQEVTVHVTEPSEFEYDDEDFSLEKEETVLGKGYYTLEGQRYPVRISGVKAGDVREGTLPVINASFGAPEVYQSFSRAVMQILWSVGAVVLGVLAYLLIRFGWSVVRGTPPPKLPLIKALGNSRRRLKP